jgi:hypothetical protein
MNDKVTIGLEQLTHVEVRCACGGGLVLPISKGDRQQQRQMSCPECSEYLHNGVHAALQFRDAYSAAQAFAKGKDGQAIRLHLSRTDT